MTRAVLEPLHLSPNWLLSISDDKQKVHREEEKNPRREEVITLESIIVYFYCNNYRHKTTQNGDLQPVSYM